MCCRDRGPDPVYLGWLGDGWPGGLRFERQVKCEGGDSGPALRGALQEDVTQVEAVMRGR